MEGLIAKIKLFLATAAGKATAGAVAVAVVGAGGYWGLYLPNTPQNKLIRAVDNTLAATHSTAKGSVNFKPKNGGGPAINADFELQSNNEKKVMGGNVKVAVSGVNIPVEFRYIDNSLFIRLGDLSSLSGIASLADPSAGELVRALSDKLKDQWIEIDQSLLNTASSGSKCDLNSTLSEDDRKKIVDIYKKNKFAEITGTSSEEVNGQKATKMDLKLNKDKAKEFGNSLKNVEYFKNLEKCSGQSASGDDSAEEKINQVDPKISVWVAGGKIVKIAITVSDENGEVTVEAVLDYKPVDIQKPEGAKPFMEVFSEFGPLFGGMLGGSAGSSAPAGAPSNSADIQKCSQELAAAGSNPNALSAKCKQILGIQQ